MHIFVLLLVATSDYYGIETLYHTVIKNLQFLVVRLTFVRNTGLFDEPITAIVNGCIATCNSFRPK